MVESLDLSKIPCCKEKNQLPFEGLIHDLGQHDGLHPWPYLDLSCVYGGLQVLQGMRTACVLQRLLQLESELVKAINH